MRYFVKLALAMTCGAAVALGAGDGGAQTGGKGPSKPIPYARMVKHKPSPAKRPASPKHGAIPVKRPVAIKRPTAPPAKHPSAVPAKRPSSAAAAPKRTLPPAHPALGAATAVLPPPEPGARLSPGAPAPPAELEAFVDGVVRQAMGADHIAGVTVAVVQNGQVVLKKGYGFAGPDRLVDPDATLFRIGSISETFTWIALMREAEAGRIRLDTPINLYLPEPLQVRDQGFKQPVLARDLMNHTAGFADRTLGQLNEDNPARVRPLALYLRQERPRRVREPGLPPTYSDYGAALAGEAVAWVNGRLYPDIIESEILRPLNMGRTSVREPYPPRADLPAPMPAPLAAQVSSGYRWTGGGLQPERFEFLSQAAPADAASSSADDMARYMMMILNGGQLDGASLYGPDIARGFRTASASAAPGVAGLDNGFEEFALPGGYAGQGHLGDTLWFHAAMVTVPKLGLGVFVAANTDTGEGLARNLPGRIVARFYASPSETPRGGSADLADQAAVYNGTYLTSRRAFNGLEQFVDLLIGQARVRVTDDGRMLISRDGTTSAWVPDGPDGRFIRADGPQISAFQIEDGRAVRWFDPSGVGTYDRIGPQRQRPTLALAAALAALASIATVVGPFTRDRREFRQTPMQARAGQVQTAIAVLWLLAMGLFAIFAMRSGDIGYVMYAWPTPYLLIGSACALVAALLTALTVAMAPAVWRGGRRVDSWTPWRKLRFTLSTLIFAAFSILLGLWGALEPWSG